jgi:hypothetical protein
MGTTPTRDQIHAVAAVAEGYPQNSHTRIKAGVLRCFVCVIRGRGSTVSASASESESDSGREEREKVFWLRRLREDLWGEFDENAMDGD